MASALVVATEWFPKTSNFQVNFVQRETARLLRKDGRKVFYTVLEATDNEEEDARYHGITLVVAEEKPEAQFETPRIDRLMLHESFFPQLKDCHHVDLIVGHATADPEEATANAARCIQQGVVKFRKAKCVFFFHTIPTELGLPVGQIQELERNMLEFGSVGSFIVSVGPKIWNYFQNKISKDKRQLCYFPFVDRKFLLLPFEEHNVQYGIDVLSFYSTCAPTETPLGKFSVLAKGFGKISEHFEFDDLKPRWRFIGVNIDYERFQERLHNMADSPSHLQVNTGPVESLDDLYTALQQCQLVVHGPQSDPFGIIGLMACTAGIPTLVTSNSGFGLFLKKYFPEIADNFVVSVGLNESEEDSDIWKKRVMKVLRNYPTALKQAQRLKKEIRSSGKEGVIAKSQRNFGQHCAQLVKQGGVIKKIEPDVNEERVKEKSGKHDEVVLTSKKRKLEEEENITFPPPLQETIQGVQSLISETTECIQSTSTGIRHPHQQKRKKDEIHNSAVSDIESANRSEQTAGSSHNKWLRQPREIGVHVNPDEIIFNERMTTEDVILRTKAYISRRIFDNVRSMEDIPSAMEYAERIGIIPDAYSTT
ncbi:uncharacterized protein [Ptychodera flava]|uniref:uncharacterized protein n=1 Tax=Ptychodera flava TaxID=63121 RepID=UPI00396A2C27